MVGLTKQSVDIKEMSVASARSLFPALTQDVTYLDTSASALKPQAVIDTMNDAMSTYYANIHRGLYAFSQESTRRYEEARAKIARFIHAHNENEIIFTRNGTEAINLVVSSWGRQNLKQGDVVLITELEHHANIVPWYLLSREIGFTVDVIRVTDNGALDEQDFEKKIQNPAVKFLSFSGMSNALGTILPAKEMIQSAKEKGITTLVDGCQLVMHGTVDVQALDCDFFVFSGHKLYGPSGIGVLYGREDMLNAMPPYQGGGDMIEHVSFDEISFKKVPSRFEAGTPAIVEAIGLGAAIDFLEGFGMDAIHEYETTIFQQAKQRLNEFDGLTLIDPGQNHTAVLSFVMEGMHPQDIATLLDKQNIAVRVGHHCTEPLMARLGLGEQGTVRASLGLYNNEDDIDQLMVGLEKVKRLLG